MYNFITKNILIFRQNKRNYFIVKGLMMKMLRERRRLKKMVMAYKITLS